MLPRSRRRFSVSEQPLVVALVQADRGLVEHVEHAGQPRADLARQADALALAARQRAGGAGERQVVEADIDQEAQPVADLLQDAGRDLVLLVGELLRQRLEPVARRACTDRAATWPMCRPPIFTASASGFSRLPPQASQGVSDM